jgi:hypothetical protein
MAAQAKGVRVEGRYGNHATKCCDTTTNCAPDSQRHKSEGMISNFYASSRENLDIDEFSSECAMSAT